MLWEEKLRQKIKNYESMNANKEQEVTVLIKVGVSSGCFHREHSPYAYKIINEYMDSHPSKEYLFEEHESGPEILTSLLKIAQVINFPTSVINLVTAIIKARTEGIFHGDRKNAPIELAVRTFDENGKLRKEKVLRIETGQEISKELIEKMSLISVNKIFPKRK